MSAQWPSVIQVFCPSMSQPPSSCCTRAAADSGDVAAGVGLAEQLTPDMLAAPNRWQQRSLLFFGTEVQQDVCGQVDLVDGPWRAGAQDLLARRCGRAAGGDRRDRRARPASRHRRTPPRTGRRTTCAAALPVRRSPALGALRALRSRGACSAMCALTRFLKSASCASRGPVADGTHQPDPPPAERDSHRAVPSRWAFVKTRRSSWCSGYSQVKPMPPDSCMHSSTAAVRLPLRTRAPPPSARSRLSSSAGAWREPPS